MGEDLPLVSLSMEAPECAQASPCFAMHVVVNLVPLSMEAPECAQASPIYAMHVVVKRIKAGGGFVYRGCPRWEECIFRYLSRLVRVSLLHFIVASTFAPTPTVSVLF